VVDAAAAAADVFEWWRRGNDLSGLAFESEIVEPPRTRATSPASIDAAGKLAVCWRRGTSREADRITTSSPAGLATVVGVVTGESGGAGAVPEVGVVVVSKRSGCHVRGKNPFVRVFWKKEKKGAGGFELPHAPPLLPQPHPPLFFSSCTPPFLILALPFCVSLAHFFIYCTHPTFYFMHLPHVILMHPISLFIIFGLVVMITLCSPHWSSMYPIFCFSLSSFFIKLFPFIYLFICFYFIFYYYLFIFIYLFIYLFIILFLFLFLFIFYLFFVYFLFIFVYFCLFIFIIPRKPNIWKLLKITKNNKIKKI